MNSPSRYAALLRVCDMACARAVETQADFRPDFWDALAAALEDDCPQQSKAAHDVAKSLRSIEIEQLRFREMLTAEVSR